MDSKDLLSGLGKIGSKYNSLSSLNSRHLPSIPEENDSSSPSLETTGESMLSNANSFSPSKSENQLLFFNSVTESDNSFTKIREASKEQKDPSKIWSTLVRLEDEDVTDPYSSVSYFGSNYLEVIDPEIIEVIRDTFNNIDALRFTSEKYIYIGKQNRIYRKPILGKVEEVSSLLGAEAIVKPIIHKSLLDDVVGKKASNSVEILPDQVTKATGETKQKIKPSYEFKSNIYSDIMSGKNSDRNSDEEYSWLEDRIKRVEKKKDKTLSSKSDHFSLKELNKIEKDISAIKSAEFQKYKECYSTNLTSLNVCKNQIKLSEPRYFKEISKVSQEQDKDFINGHISLKETVSELEMKLIEIKENIEGLVNRKSPYSYGDIKMPKFGKKDSFQTESVKLFPIVSSDEDISIKDLFTCMSEWSENEGLSESALKRAIFSRLRGPRAKSWITYQKQPIKEAITSMIMLYDKHDSPMKYSNLIKDFKKLPNEDIQNSVGRLIHATNKYLEFRPSSEQKVIRREILISKLGILLSARGYSEVFRKLEETKQLGCDLSEKELLSLIYTEDMFDKRSNMDNYLQINNINREDAEDLCEDLELSAIEHKRKPGDPLDTPIFRRPDFKQAKTTSEPSLYRPIITPKRTIPNYSSNKPIMVGRDNRSYVKIGNPNPNNKWHNRENYRESNHHRYGYDDRKAFISSRNAPLVQQNPRLGQDRRYNNEEFRRHNNQGHGNYRYDNQRFDSEKYRNQRYNGQRYDRDYYYKPQTRVSHPLDPSYQRKPQYNNQNDFRQNRNNFHNGIRHNVHVRANPARLFQSITVEELNSLCIDCPRKVEEHKISECPNLTGQVFRKASIPKKHP